MYLGVGCRTSSKPSCKIFFHLLRILGQVIVERFLLIEILTNEDFYIEDFENEAFAGDLLEQ